MSSGHFKIISETYGHCSQVLPIKTSYLCTKTATFKGLDQQKFKDCYFLINYLRNSMITFFFNLSVRMLSSITILSVLWGKKSPLNRKNFYKKTYVLCSGLRPLNL